MLLAGHERRRMINELNGVIEYISKAELLEELKSEKDRVVASDYKLIFS